MAPPANLVLSGASLDPACSAGRVRRRWSGETDMDRSGQHDADPVAALAVLLVQQLPAAVEAARTRAVEDKGPLSPSRFLEAWCDELAQRLEVALSPARVVAAIPVLFAVCEIGIEMAGSRPGIHLRGTAVPALSTTLRIMKAHDTARGTQVGEALMAMLLADIAQVLWSVEDHGRGAVH